MEKEFFYLLGTETNKILKIEAIKNEGRRQWQSVCSKCKRRGETLIINKEAKTFHCYGCGWKGDLKKSRQFEQQESEKKMKQGQGIPVSQGNPVSIENKTIGKNEMEIAVNQSFVESQAKVLEGIYKENVSLKEKSIPKTDKSNVNDGAIFKNHWRNYHGLGFIPFPASKKHKGPIVEWKDEQKKNVIQPPLEDYEKWEKEYADSNIWLLIGDFRVVLDPDGPKAEKFVQDLNLPKCPTSISGNKSIHRWFKASEPLDYIQVKFGENDFLEVRTGNFGIMAPPSIHPETGRAYQWKENSALWDIPLPEFPKEVYEKIFSLLPKPKSKPCSENNDSNLGRFDVEKYLSDYGVEVSGVKQHGDLILYRLRQCLWSGEHGHGDNRAMGRSPKTS